MLEVASLMGNFATAIEHPDQREVRDAAVRILSAIKGHQDFFPLIRNFFAQVFPDFDFDREMLRLFVQLSDVERYNMAALLSLLYCREADHANALRFWGQGLVSARDCRPGEDGGVISSRRVGEYDKNPLHIEAANKVCLFALGGFLERMLSRNLRVLDIGCGSGLNSDTLAFFSEHLTGLDMELDGLKSSGRHDRYHALFQGDARKTIEAVEGSFDLLISTCAMYFFRDMDWLFEQASRLLRKGGAIVFNGWPCPDEEDVMLTASGTHRHCHSEQYLRRVAARHGLVLAEKLWTPIYRLPNWLLRFELAPA